MSKRNAICNTIEDLIKIHKDFYIENGKYPISKDFHFNPSLPSKETVNRLLVNENIPYNRFLYNYFYMLNIKNLKYKKNVKEYDFLVSIFKNYCDKLNYIPLAKDISEKYGLPTTRWFVENSNKDEVIDYSTFVEYELKLIHNHSMSKEVAKKVILEMQSKLNRPLVSKDFGSIYHDGMCETLILRHWGSINKMKVDLGLEILKESMRDKEKSIEDVKNDVKLVCEYIKETENRTLIIQSDWDKAISSGLDIYKYGSARKKLEQNGTTLREHVVGLGYDMVKAGVGLNYDYIDGESVSSQYEKIFTDFLKERLGLIYNKDYLRSVRYTGFIPSYVGKMDCDYVINYNDRKIYIEIAGILNAHTEQWRTFDYKRIEKTYRCKLLLKEQMLKENGLDYYIIFPRDCNEEFFMSIFK